MDSNALKVGWFWVRANFRQRWSNYLTIVLLVGSIGGLAIGSVSAAQRTQSSYNVFLASTNPSDLSVAIYAPNIASELARLPHVKDVGVSSYSVNAFPAGKDGAPAFPAALESGTVISVGSLKKEYFSEDRVALVSGRLPNPDKANEFVIDSDAERQMGWHVGEEIPMYFYTDAQTEHSTFGTDKIKPHVTLTMHLVGTIIPNDDVLLDEVDRTPEFIIYTPALTKRLVNNGVHYNNYALQLDRGPRDVSVVEREIISALPKGTTYSFHVNSVIAAEVNRSIEPESIALGVFGLIAGLAALIIAAGLIARTLQSESDDIEIVRALGASPMTSVTASLMGLVGAIVVGALLALLVAVALSPLSPIGPVRAVYPQRGVAIDGLVFVVGFLALVAILVSLSVLLTRRRVRRAQRRRRLPSSPVSSRISRLIAEIGFPLPAVVGVRFAVEPGRERDAVPVRSALVGAALAVTIVVATLTFGNSLTTLVTHPALYGWNWNYAMTSQGNGVPLQALPLLKKDPYVAAFSGDSFANAQIDGVTVPIILTHYFAKVTAPMLSGHEVDAPGQVVLGAATLDQLHKKVGESVTVTYGSKKDYPVYVPPTKAKIVGTATLPAIGGILDQHTSMGIGAIVPIDIEPPAFQKYLRSPYKALDGPSVILIRLKEGVSSQAAYSSLKKIAEVATKDQDATPDGGGESIGVEAVQYPAEIENYRTIGVIPDILALALALGAVVALGLTLVASVHRRRRDLALLRTLGFSRRQLMATVAWQASVAGLIGVMLGIPLGIALGRWLWILFAHSIFAVAKPTVPVISLLVVALSALLLANIVAALPGRRAAQTSTAQVLRGE